VDSRGLQASPPHSLRWGEDCTDAKALRDLFALLLPFNSSAQRTLTDAAAFMSPSRSHHHHRTPSFSSSPLLLPLPAPPPLPPLSLLNTAATSGEQPPSLSTLECFEGVSTRDIARALGATFTLDSHCRVSILEWTEGDEDEEEEEEEEEDDDDEDESDETDESDSEDNGTVPETPEHDNKQPPLPSPSSTSSLAAMSVGSIKSLNTRAVGACLAPLCRGLAEVRLTESASLEGEVRHLLAPLCAVPLAHSAPLTQQHERFGATEKGGAGDASRERRGSSSRALKSAAAAAAVDNSVEKGPAKGQQGENDDDGNEKTADDGDDDGDNGGVRLGVRCLVLDHTSVSGTLTVAALLGGNSVVVPSSSTAAPAPPDFSVIRQDPSPASSRRPAPTLQTFPSPRRCSSWSPSSACDTPELQSKRHGANRTGRSSSISRSRSSSSALLLLSLAKEDALVRGHGTVARFLAREEGRGSPQKQQQQQQQQQQQEEEEDAEEKEEQERQRGGGGGGCRPAPLFSPSPLFAKSRGWWATNSTLVELRLAHTKVSGPLKALAVCCCLKTLDVSGCPLVCGPVAKHLSRCSLLEEVWLDGCSGVSGGVNRFGCRYLKNLKLLSASHTSLELYDDDAPVEDSEDHGDGRGDDIAGNVDAGDNDGDGEDAGGGKGNNGNAYGDGDGGSKSSSGSSTTTKNSSIKSGGCANEVHPSPSVLRHLDLGSTKVGGDLAELLGSVLGGRVLGRGSLLLANLEHLDLTHTQTLTGNVAALGLCAHRLRVLGLRGTSVEGDLADVKPPLTFPPVSSSTAATAAAVLVRRRGSEIITEEGSWSSSPSYSDTGPDTDGVGGGGGLLCALEALEHADFRGSRVTDKMGVAASLTNKISGGATVLLDSAAATAARIQAASAAGRTSNTSALCSPPATKTRSPVPVARSLLSELSPGV